jgi:transcriptional regulator with XRE-family HTH domain
MSQSELARQVSLNQSTIAALINGKSRSSAHLHLIARSLRTTPAYLVGETDDPDEGAPPPPPEPRLQLVTAQVALPTEAALTQAFQALLMASPGLAGDELAHELAKRLPTILSAVRGPLIEPVSDQPGIPQAEAEAPGDDRPAPRRARRR